MKDFLYEIIEYEFPELLTEAVGNYEEKYLELDIDSETYDQV